MSAAPVAIVTGAAEGIGWATAQQLAHAGWSVALFDLNGALTAERAQALGAQHSGWACDVTDADAVKAQVSDVVARHGWTDGRKFLLVPYHMIGATDMESAILGGYAEFVRKRHPEAPVPGFYLSERLFEDAVRMRKRSASPVKLHPPHIPGE